jgi:hypothetical protein
MWLEPRLRHFVWTGELEKLEGQVLLLLRQPADAAHLL